MPAKAAQAVTEAAEELAARVTAAGDALPAPFKEKQMQSLFVEALDDVLRLRQLELRVKQNLSVKFAEWPGVGPVDVALLDPDGAPAGFVELKWGAGTLYNCVWDVEKMAVAVACAHAAAAFLVAGAPAAHWEASDGSELFQDPRPPELRRPLVACSGLGPSASCPILRSIPSKIRW